MLALLMSLVSVQLGLGATITTLKPTEDAILLCSSGVKVGATIILGGHDVTLRGCRITIPAERPKSDMYRRAVYVKGATGTVTIEDVRVTNPFRQQFDGFFLAAPEASVVLRNVRVEGLFGWQREFHSDAVQNSATRTLEIDGMTIVGGYQMLNLGSGTGSGSSESILLQRINGRFVGRQVWNKDGGSRGDNGGTFIWLVQGADTCVPVAPKITLKDVYARLYSDRGPGGAGWPNDRKAGCAAKVSTDKRSTTWPTLPVYGKVVLRNPPKGDFVP